MSAERPATEDLPAYALGALGEAERDIVAAHVDRCAQCTRDLAQFEDALYEAAAIGAVQVEPPRDLRTRIVLRPRGARGREGANWTARLAGVLVRPVPLAGPAVPAPPPPISFAGAGTKPPPNHTYQRTHA